MSIGDESSDRRFLPLIGVGGVFLIVGAVIGIRVLGIADTKVLGVVDQNAQREVFEQSKAYRDGVRRDLDELQLSYVRAQTAEEKAAVLSVLRHRVEGVPVDLVPADVRAELR